MIDPKSETLIRLVDVPRLEWIPKKKTGDVSGATVHRWATIGIRGVVLEVLAIGGTRHTTESAIIRFFERLTVRHGASNTVTASQGVEAHNKAKERLKQFGI